MGIIDILQVYNTNKRLENFFKGFSHDRKQLSAVDPSLYAERMVNFLLTNSDYGDAIKASKMSAKQPTHSARHSAPQLNNSDLNNSGEKGRQRAVSSPHSFKNNDNSTNNPNNYIHNNNNNNNNNNNDKNNNTVHNASKTQRSINDNNSNGSSFRNNNDSDKIHDRYKLL